MKKALVTLSDIAFGSFRVIYDFIGNPNAIYLRITDQYFLKIASLVLWSLAFSRYAAQKHATVISLFFSGDAEIPTYFTLTATPFLGELVSLVEIAFLVMLAIPALKYWAKSSTNSNYEKSIEVVLLFIALGLLLSNGVQLIANQIALVQGVDRETYFMTRKVRMGAGFLTLLLLIPMFANLRSLNKILSTKVFIIGIIIWLFFQVVGSFLKFEVLRGIVKAQQAAQPDAFAFASLLQSLGLT